jgi:hypothetical protein
MAVTYAEFDASKPHGGTIAKGADLIRRGRDLINRAYEAANAVTDAGTTKDNLIAGDFGAVDSANAALLWTALSTVKNLLDADDAGGLSSSLASLDKGLSE